MHDPLPLAGTASTSLPQRLLLALAFAIVGGLALTSAWTLAIAHWPGVYTDMWDELPFLQRLDSGNSTLQDWFNAYAGSHRLVLPRLVFAAEHRWFHHGNTLALAVSLLLQAGTVALVLGFLRREQALSPLLKGCLTALVLACGVSSLHLYNLLYAFLVQWFQVVGLSLATFALAVLARGHTRSTALFAGAGLLALLASFCNFPGVIALFNLGLLAIALRLPKRAYLFIACLLAVTVQVASLPKGSIPGGEVLAAIQAQPAMLLAYPLYVLRFLGAPLTRLSETAGMLLGFWVLVWTAWHGVRWLWQGPRDASTLQSFSLASLMWLCGTGVATALGRGLIPVTAVAERFDTVHLWIIPFLLVHMACVWRSPRARPILTTLACAQLLALLPLQAQGSAQALQTANKVQKAHIAYSLDMRDWRTHALLSVPHRAAKTNPALDWRDYLQRTGNGIFALPAAHWPGLVFPQDPALLPECPANVALQPVGGGFVDVKISTPYGNTPPKVAWLLDDEKRVIGYALRENPETLFATTSRLAGYAHESGLHWVIANPQTAACRISTVAP